MSMELLDVPKWIYCFKESATSSFLSYDEEQDNARSQRDHHSTAQVTTEESVKIEASEDEEKCRKKRKCYDFNDDQIARYSVRQRSMPITNDRMKSNNEQTSSHIPHYDDSDCHFHRRFRSSNNIGCHFKYGFENHPNLSPPPIPYNHYQTLMDQVNHRDPNWERGQWNRHSCCDLSSRRGGTSTYNNLKFWKRRPMNYYNHDYNNNCQLNQSRREQSPRQQHKFSRNRKQYSFSDWNKRGRHQCYSTRKRSLVWNGRGYPPPPLFNDGRSRY